MNNKQARAIAAIIKNNDGTVNVKTKICVTEPQINFILTELKKYYGNNMKFEVKKFAI